MQKTKYSAVVPPGYVLAKRRRLTVSLSKFHIDEYFDVWELTEDAGHSKQDKDYGNELSFVLVPGDLFAVNVHARPVEVLPGVFMIARSDVLCRIIGEVIEE